MTIAEALVVLLAGAVSGAMNTFAGAGGAVAIPVLTALLGNPIVALATFRVGIVTQSLVGLKGFLYVDNQLSISRRALAIMLAMGVVGGLLGAQLAARSNPAWYGTLVIGSLAIIVGMLALGLWRHTPRPAQAADALAASVAPPWSPMAQAAALLLTATYGGFLQVGVTFLLLLVLERGYAMSVITALGTRNAITLALNVVALVSLSISGMVDWRAGAVLAVGSALGAELAVRLALKQRERTLKIAAFGLACAALVAAVVKLVAS